MFKNKYFKIIGVVFVFITLLVIFVLIIQNQKISYLYDNNNDNKNTEKEMENINSDKLSNDQPIDKLTKNNDDTLNPKSQSRKERMMLISKILTEGKTTYKNPELRKFDEKTKQEKN
ncbi:MAG: hypothetical protein Q8784_00605 [Vigna little leaf phytoplasma]|nr:hypothetical protein [Vigna little leaf phytoplasma]